MPETGAEPRAGRALNKLPPEQEEGAGALDEQAHTGSQGNKEQESHTPRSQSERLGKHCPWPQQDRKTAAERDSFNYSKRNSK